jgi:arylsulfatase A-like enzyme
MRITNEGGMGQAWGIGGRPGSRGSSVQPRPHRPKHSVRRSERSAASLLALAVGATALALTATAFFGCSQEPAGENTIVILVDTLRRDALGCYGNSQHPTPRIDAIAADGVRFEQAVSTSGWTLPAVASLLTGTWPTIHGAVGKGTALFPLRQGLTTAAEWYKQHGYATLAVTNAAFVSPHLSMDRGFDVYDHEPAYNLTLRRADKTVDVALDLIRAHRNERNFVFIHLFDSHLDYDPPAAYRTRFTNGRDLPQPPLSMAACLALRQAGGQPPTPEDIAYVKGVYLGEVGFVDEQIVRMVYELKRMRLYERTTLVITSDHGEEFWEHGGFEHGHTLYDELVHIPLIIKAPAGTPHPQPVVPSQVRLIDVMPTLFELAGLPKPESFVGTSLARAMRGEPQGDLTAFCESLMYGPDKLLWRNGVYVYIYTMDPQATDIYELYNWREDPEQRVNLFPRDPRFAHRFHEELARFYTDLKAQAAKLPPSRIIDMSPQQLESLKSLHYVR